MHSYWRQSVPEAAERPLPVKMTMFWQSAACFNSWSRADGTSLLVNSSSWTPQGPHTLEWFSNLGFSRKSTDRVYTECTALQPSIKSHFGTETKAGLHRQASRTNEARKFLVLTVRIPDLEARQQDMESMSNDEDWRISRHWRKYCIHRRRRRHA